MKFLLAPLNWGLGHASRCVPLVQRFLNEGHEVVLGGDGESLTLLRKHFPQLRYVRLAPLTLRYGAGNSQVWAMIKALPKLILWAIKDHALLQALLREEHFDRIISDNRFGLFISNRRSRSNSVAVQQRSGLTAEGGLTAKRSYSVSGQTQSVYITHQLHILFPRGWRWLEPLAERLHAHIMRRFDEVWVPDYEDFDQSLAGELSHPNHQSPGASSRLTGGVASAEKGLNNDQSPITRNEVNRALAAENHQLKYIGPLSRFSYSEAVLQPKAVLQRSGLIAKGGHYDVVVVLSGLEPQRSLLEQEIIRRYTNNQSPGASSRLREEDRVRSAEKGLTHNQSPITNHQSPITTPSVLIVQGRPGAPGTTVRRGNITLVPSLGDDELAAALIGARHIIARSGYSTIMDLHALGLLHHQSQITRNEVNRALAAENHQLELLPTPGQPEQEYLAERMKRERS